MEKIIEYKIDKNSKKIFITRKAEKQIKILIKKKFKKKILEIYIKKSGCAGLEYKMKFIENKKDNKKNKKYIILKNKIHILINKKYLKILNNTKIDFIKEGINKKFKFINEKIKNFCGCGKSFNI
ncbi:iron-sulfur cluster assembly accessory protein [Buchnera aphidicola (Ceratovacuna keduensis)]|uniref:HesB/IscA family protein n=1 Tax=Buchnera aphidicola TaxID=9 RepID=UPI0031B8117E